MPEDTACQVFAMTALGGVRAAQQRDDEAEEIFRTAIELARKSNYRLFEQHPLEWLVDFLRDRGREDDAAIYEARLAELTPATDSRTERIA